MERHGKAGLWLILAAVGCAGAETPALRTCEEDSDCGEGAFCRGSVCLLDDAAPRLALTNPAEGTLVTGERLRVEGSLEDGDGAGIERVEYAFGDAGFVEAAWQAEPFSLEVDVPALDNVPTTLRVRALDRMGNVAARRVALRVDRVAPRITVTGLQKSCFGLAEAGQTIEVGFAATDGDRVASLELSTDDGTSWRPGDPAAGLRWSREVGATPVADERLRLLVRAVDSVGNRAHVATEITIDTIAPSLAVSEPAEGAILISETSMLRGTVIDPNADEIAYALAGEAPQVALPTGGRFEASLSVPDVDWSERALEVRARDRCGNETSQTLALRLDRQPPRLVLYAPEDGVLSTPQAPSFRIGGQATEAALMSLTWRVDDAAPVGIPSRFETVYSPPQVTDYKEHTLTVEATDAAGHLTVERRRFAIDWRPPLISLANLPSGTVFNASTPSPFEVQGTVKDDDLAGVRIEYSWDGGAVAPVEFSAAASGQFSFPLFLSDWEQGGVTHTLQIAATDRAGNRAQVATSYQNDRVGPLIDIIVPPVDAVCSDSCSGAVFNAASPVPYAVRGILRLDPGDAVGSRPVFRRESSGFTLALPTIVEESGWRTELTPQVAIDGEFFSVEWTARDSAGNKSETRRRLYWDHVAPSIVTPALRRALSPEHDPVVEFSEAVATLSLRAEFESPHSGHTLKSPDGRRFYFAAPDQVERAAVHRLVVSAASDRAGNPLPSPVRLEFRTIPHRPATLSRLAGPAEQPLLVLDGEDLPWVLFYRPAPLEEVALVRWDGETGAWTDVPFGMLLPNGSLEHFEIRSTRAADGYAFVHEATALYVSRGNGRQSWFVLDGPVAQPRMWTRTGPDIIPPVVFPLGSNPCEVDCEGWRDQWVLAMETPETIGWTHLQRPEFHQAEETPSRPQLARGPALVWDDQLAYPIDSHVGLAIDADGTGVVIAGTSRTSTSPAFLAAATYEDEGEARGPSLRLVCNSMPGNPGGWQSSVNLHPEAGRASTTKVRAIRMTSNDAGVGIALDGSDGSVHFGLVADAACLGAPTQVNWLAKRTNARDGSVAVDSQGKLWFAYVDAAGELVVEH